MPPAEGRSRPGEFLRDGAIEFFRVQRPVFTDSKMWEKPVTVSGNQVSVVNFALSK